MAFVAGHNSNIKYDSAAGTPTDISAYVNSIGGFDLKRATLDVTAFGNSAMAYILGLKGGQSVTLSGDWDSTLHTLMTGVEALTTGASQTLSYSPAGTAAGTPIISAETFLTQYSVNSAVADKVTWSATLQVTGATTTTGTN